MKIGGNNRFLYLSWKYKYITFFHPHKGCYKQHYFEFLKFKYWNCFMPF